MKVRAPAQLYAFVNYFRSRGYTIPQAFRLWKYTTFPATDKFVRPIQERDLAWARR